MNYDAKKEAYGSKQGDSHAPLEQILWQGDEGERLRR